MNKENKTSDKQQNGNDFIADVSSSVSKPLLRVRFYPKDTDDTYDGTVIEETQYSYLVAPDDNLTGTARWNKKCCDILH